MISRKFADTLTLEQVEILLTDTRDDLKSRALNQPLPPEELNEISNKIAACVFVVYPRMAEKLLGPNAWLALQSAKVEGTFTDIGIKYKGHDVFVYWSFDSVEVNELYALLPRTVTERTTPSLRPTPPAKVQ